MLLGEDDKVLFQQLAKQPRLVAFLKTQRDRTRDDLEKLGSKVEYLQGQASVYRELLSYMEQK